MSKLELDERTRLLLFHGSPTPVSTALCVDLTGVGALRLRELGVTADNLRAASIGPVLLRSAGVASATELRTLGLDACDARDPGFASESIACFGASASIDAFVVSASDAVCIVNSRGCEVLGIGPERLLKSTAGSPDAAKAVLSELPEGAVSEVTLETLMSTGIQLSQLSQVGISLHKLMEVFSPTTEQLRVMGAKVNLK